jgi:hypothetical protein
MVHANNDWTGIPDDRIQEVEKGLEQHPFLIVLDDITDFSKASCDACRTHLAGARFSATTI